jgi:erythromycin esterase
MTDKKSFTDWSRHHAIAADSLNPQAPLDDLEPLHKVIGDARVVAIGESAHYVRECYLLRHRLLRFLAERLGFTVYALEAPFTEAHAIDAWIQGSPGTVEEVAATGVSFSQGRSREMYDHLEWMRAYNRTVSQPLRFAGIGVPASGGSPLPALEEVADYLRRADQDAMALLEQAAELARKYHDTATFRAINRYTTLDRAVQDALSAALSRLLSRMETMGAYQRSQEHATALQHLRGAFYLDPFHRDLVGRGIPSEHPHALHDAFMAWSVLQLPEVGDPDRDGLPQHPHPEDPSQTRGRRSSAPWGLPSRPSTRGRLRSHRRNQQRWPHRTQAHGPRAPTGLQGPRSPAASPRRRQRRSRVHNRGALAVADLRAARPLLHDAESFQRMRMEDYFMDVLVFDAFDAVAHVSHTSCTEYVAEPMAS